MVIVTGTLGFDNIMDFPGKFVDRIMPDKIHRLSLSFLVNKLNKNFGGTAGNIAYTLKLLGIDPVILSSAGNDFAPYKKHLKKNNITQEFIKEYADDSTGAYFVITDKEDNQIGSFYTGASKYNYKLTLKNIIGPSLIVISPNEPKAMNKYVNECIDFHLPYLFDPAFQIDNLNSQELMQGISHAQILISNDYEMSLIEKKINLPHSQLVKLVSVVITTLGSQGSLIESHSQKIQVKPAKPINISDPTGAGDAYRAGFLAGYLRNLDLSTCGQMGSMAAVYTVEKYGTQTHKFTIKDFAIRFYKNYHKILLMDEKNK